MRERDRMKKDYVEKAGTKSKLFEKNSRTAP
jgi:hypothetical protein